MLGQKVIIQFAAAGASGLLAFLALSLSARWFGPEILGQVVYYLGILGLIFAFTDLGLSRAHIHFTASNSGQPEIGPFLALKLPLLLLAFLAGLAIFYWQALTGIFIILLVAEVFSRVADSLLISFEGQEKVWPQNLLKIGAKFCRVAALIIFGWRLANVYGYALTFFIEALLIFTGALLLRRNWLNFHFDRGSIKRYLNYSLPFAVIMPLSYLQDNGLILMLKHWQGSVVLGIYAAGFGLFGFLKTFSSSLMIFFFPRISRLSQAKDLREIQAYTDMAVKFSVWILTPILFILLIISQWLVPLVLGREFIAAIAIFRWYLFGVLVLSIFSPYDHVLFATNNHHSIVKVNLVTTILLLLLGWQLIPIFGGLGAAIASVISWLVGGIWQFTVLHQKTGIKFLTDWRLSRVEVKYLYGLYNSFSQAGFWPGRKKTG